MTDRRPIVAANWKMHKTHLEAIQAVQKLGYLLTAEDAERIEVVVCPPFTALRSVQTLVESDRLPFALGAQNVHWEAQGAFTGEVSPPMLAALKCRYVIVGHSEPADAGQVVTLIRETLTELYSADVAQAVRVQYGGSVKAANMRGFMAHPEVDGALVGGASLDPEEFALIVKYW